MSLKSLNQVSDRKQSDRRCQWKEDRDFQWTWRAILKEESKRLSMKKAWIHKAKGGRVEKKKKKDGLRVRMLTKLKVLLDHWMDCFQQNGH